MAAFRLLVQVVDHSLMTDGKWDKKYHSPAMTSGKSCSKHTGDHIEFNERLQMHAQAKKIQQKELINKKDKNEALSRTTVGHTNCKLRNNLVLSLSALM